MAPAVMRRQAPKASVTAMRDLVNTTALLASDFDAKAMQLLDALSAAGKLEDASAHLKRCFLGCGAAEAGRRLRKRRVTVVSVKRDSPPLG